MKARVVTSSPLMVSSLIIDISNLCVFLHQLHKQDHILFMSQSYQEPQGKHPQPQNRPWHETHLWYDGRIHGQGTPGQGRSSIWGYCLCLNECSVIVLVSLFCIIWVMAFICFSGLISRALPREGLHGDSKERPLITGSILQGSRLQLSHFLHLKLLVASNKEKSWTTLRMSSGTPRTAAETYEEAMKYGKQIKRESPPIRSFEGGIGKGKPYEGVSTIKEMGRSIHEIPRQDQSGQDMCKTPEMSDRRVMEGAISQVRQYECWLWLLQLFIFTWNIDLRSGHVDDVMTDLSSPPFTRFTLWTSRLSSTMSSP